MTCDQTVSGKECFDRFLASKPGTYDAILMDIQMPEMNGYEATAAIRASSHPEAVTIPIVAMTANAFTEDVAKSIANGMNDHVPKPIEPNVLFSTLSRVIRERPAAQDRG